MDVKYAVCVLETIGSSITLSNINDKESACIIAIKALDKLDKIENFTYLFEQTLDWGCNDMAKCLYANAVYSVITGKENYKECEQEFKDYMYENGIH